MNAVDNSAKMGTEQQPGLTVNDLHVMVSIIETCAERGAFEAKEMVAVGSAYNKLVAFLSSQVQQPPAPQTQTPQPDQPSVEPVEASNDQNK